MINKNLNRRLKALIAFRVLLVTVLLGSFFFLRIGYGIFPYTSSVMYLIAIVYGLTIVHLTLLGRIGHKSLAYMQIVGDVAGTVALIFLTGGIESWFSSLLVLNVISAAMVINGRAGYIAATLSAILYGGLIDMQFYRVLPIPFDPMTVEKDFLFNIFTHITGLYLTAFLMGQLIMRLERQDINLRDLTLFNREVIENTPSGLFTTDQAGTVQIFNRAAEKITGISRSMAAGRNVHDLFPFLPEALTWPVRIEETIDAGGTPKVIGLMLSGMYDASGTETGHIGIFEDLTELKKMGEEIKRKEKLAAIGELSANIAHEIRNPLASLKSSIELIREGSVTAAQRDRLMGIAINEMDRLNAIVTDFLDYTRPTPPDLQACDLHSILNHTTELLQGSGRQDIAITGDYEGTFPVMADTRMLQQVFLNLGLNAFDAMPSGGTLRISTERLDGRARIRFLDSGTGIDPANRERVFYPFYTTKKTGTGIGLSIAYRIVVEDHDGMIHVESPPEGGTEFIIDLPLDKGEEKVPVR